MFLTVFLILVTAAIAAFFYFVYKQQSAISFYEKQGVYCYPGCRRWLMGNYKEVESFVHAYATDPYTEVQWKWLWDNVGKFVDKKVDVPKWKPTVLKNILGLKISIQDPEIIQDFMNDKSLLEKSLSSGFMMIWNKRARINVFTLLKSSEQVQRRRAFSNGFSGARHFKMMDGIVEKVLKNHIKSIQASPSDKVHDLRAIIIDIFEQLVTMYMFGRDISKDKIMMHVLKKDGTIAREEKKLFPAFATGMQWGVEAYLANLILGDIHLTKTQKIFDENWNSVCDLLESIVLKQI